MAVTRKAIKSNTDELDDVLHNIAASINKSIKDDALPLLML